MPNPATAQDVDALKAALLARGMLAERGRYTPFALNAGNADAAVAATPGAPSSLQSVVAGNAASGVGSSAAPGAANNNDALPVPDNALDKMGESDAWKYLIGLGVGAGALTAYLLRRRRRLNEPTDDIPIVEGTVINDAKPKVTGDHLVNGEYTEVRERRVPITNTKTIAQGTTVPDNEGMRALGAPKEVDVPAITKQRTRTPKQTSTGNPVSRRTAAQALAERAARGQPNDVGTIPLKDSMADLSYDEKMQANYLTEQIIANRKAGNTINRRRMTGARDVRSTQPSGNIDRPRILNEVIRLIRQGKAGSIARVIP